MIGGDFVSEYQAEQAAQEYAAAVDQYNQAIEDRYGYDAYPEDPYADPYSDPYDYYGGQGYNGLVDDLGYYP